VFGKFRQLIQSLANQLEWHIKTSGAAHGAIMKQLAYVAEKQDKILEKQEAFDERVSYALMPHPSRDKEPKS
jgi:hypothetical protein